MERLELLDDRLRKIKSYDLTMMKYARNLIVGVMMILMLFVMIIPMDNFLFIYSSIMLMDSLATMNINPYLYIKRDGIKLSIYKGLKETCISKKAFVKSRCRYHFMFVKKIFIASIIMAFFGGFLSKGLTMDNISDGLFFIFLCFVLINISFAWELYRATKD